MKMARRVDMYKKSLFMFVGVVALLGPVMVCATHFWGTTATYDASLTCLLMQKNIRYKLSRVKSNKPLSRKEAFLVCKKEQKNK